MVNIMIVYNAGVIIDGGGASASSGKYHGNVESEESESGKEYDKCRFHS
jgi:hypothetical protein